MKQYKRILFMLIMLCVIPMGCSNKIALKIGTYRLNIDETAPSVKLSDDATYELMEPSYSSFHNPNFDKYAIEGDYIILQKKGEELRFKINEDSFTFDEGKSTTNILFEKPYSLNDGDEFVLSN